MAVTGLIDVETVRWMAKHQGERGQVVPLNTTEYVTDKILIARLTKTYVASANL